VNNVTVVFTEFQPKLDRSSSTDPAEKTSTSSPSRKASANGVSSRGVVHPASSVLSRREATQEASGSESRSSS
jgi:hypothetical protein